MKFQRVQRNHSCQSPRRLCFLSIASHRIPNPSGKPGMVRALTCGHAIHGRLNGGRWTHEKTFDFVSGRPFWEWLSRLLVGRATTWLICHDARTTLTLAGLWRAMDGGMFAIDGMADQKPSITDSKEPRDLKPGLFVWGGPPVILGLRTPKGCPLLCVDTLNYWSASVADLAESLGERLPDEPLDGSPRADHLARCQASADVVRRSMVTHVNWVSNQDMGVYRWTSAGQAYGTWRHQFSGEMPCATDDADLSSMERASYYGGWIEPFFLGEVDSPIVHVDVNSLYPAMMADFMSPLKPISWRYAKRWTPGVPPIRPEAGIAEVRISTTTEPFPVRHTNRVEMAVGEYETTLCGPELSRAVRGGHVTHYRSCCEYKMGFLFCQYVNIYWTLRKEAEASGQKLRAMFCKSMLNSLYGKFAQRSPMWEHQPAIHCPAPWGPFYVRDVANGRFTSYLAVAGHAFRQDEPRHKSGSLPAISAFIASHARQYMLRAMRACDPGQVYYIGIDGLLLTPHGFVRLEADGWIDQHKMGCFKMLGQYPSAKICGPNHYAAGNHLVAAGRKVSGQVDASGVTIQVDHPTLEQLMVTGPTDLLQEHETRKRFWELSPTRLRFGVGWLPTPCVMGAILRDADGIDVCGRDMAREDNPVEARPFGPGPVFQKGLPI